MTPSANRYLLIYIAVVTTLVLVLALSGHHG